MRAYLIRLARTLLVTLWAGSLWTVGYLIAPVLFATLADRRLAGTIAGSLFRAEAWLSVACGLLLLAIFRAEPNRILRNNGSRLVIGMLLCVLIGYFALQPFMAEIRAAEAASGGVMNDAMRTRFGLLHGIASVVYLIQSLLAAVLVWRSCAEQG